MEIAQEKVTLHAEMHRKAGKLGFSGIPKLSNIDKRWFMEVDQIATAHGRYTHTVPNIAFGTGDTPLEAAALALHWLEDSVAIQSPDDSF